MINVDVSVKIQEKMCKKGYIWNPATCSCENGRYAKSTINDAVIICHEILETTKRIMTKTIPAKSISIDLNEKKVICKIKKFYILLAFLLITKTFLIDVRIYC